MTFETKASKGALAPRAETLVVLQLFPAVIGVAATALLSAGAVRAEALTLLAGVVATAFGSFIVIVGGFPYLALLVLFVVASVMATRYRFEDKRRKNVQEGTHGERGVTNVLAHVIVPTGLVAIMWLVPSVLSAAATAFLYTAALAFGAADTFASEFGVLSGRARSLLTGRVVPAGTNGGVSVLGEVWAFVGAFTTALVGAGLFRLFSAPIPLLGTYVFGVLLAGFLGCQLDSILGETLENRSLLTKGGTNLVAMLLTVGLGAGLLLSLGGSLA